MHIRPFLLVLSLHGLGVPAQASFESDAGRTVQAQELPPGEAFFADADYNNGQYGLYVTQTFKSINITVPRLNMQKPFTNCDDGSYLFISPRGNVASPLAAIYDAR